MKPKDVVREILDSVNVCSFLGDKVMAQKVELIHSYYLSLIPKPPHKMCVKKSKEHCWCINDFIETITDLKKAMEGECLQK